MSDRSSISDVSSSDNPSTLADRVLARVQAAGIAVDRRLGATRPRSAHRRSDLVDPLAATETRSAEQVREARSLRRVFLELGDTYRAYRRQTGEPVSDTVRRAALQFRRELTMPSLVSVAASLDQLEILPW